MNRLLALSAIASCSAPLCAQPPKPCSASEFRQFDFWMGQWDAYNALGRAEGSVENVTATGGCGFIEYRRFPDGQTGVAFNIYDPVRTTWSQLWQAPGNVVRLEGRWSGTALETEGTIAPTGQAEKPFRVVWTPQPDGSVKQDFFVRGTAAAWKPWFTTIYRRQAAKP